MNNYQARKSEPSTKPVKPKKPAPTKREKVAMPVPCLAESRIREIAREEVVKHAQECAYHRLEVLAKLDAQGEG